jgi:hypothetical protein
MTYIQTIFDRASDIYATWFAEWLHIHFIIRTAVLLLILWGALFLAAQIFHYILGPLWVLFYRHVIFRMYNYLFVETPHEFIYIHFYAKDKPTFRKVYLRLSDKVKKNRLILNHTRYRGILYRGGVKRVTWTLVATVGVVATLWLTAFGLHREYYVPALAENGNIMKETPTDEPKNPEGNGDYPTNGQEPLPPVQTHPTDIIYPPGYINPAEWPDLSITLRLNGQGEAGARLRDRPGFDGVVMEMVWGGHVLEYLGDFTPDAQVPGLYWLRVRSPNGQEGYIASYLVEPE